jgi:8-oxo-dGTP pyrophosphatase MutT (NUDIX family)
MSKMAPVVAVIVTSPGGVLIGRRIDGDPPWTFIAGEIEPGESPENAADVGVYKDAFARLRALAATGDDATDLIHRVMADYENR